MTREEHLLFCQVCKNQKFDPQRGIVCALTHEIADFEENCDSFVASPQHKALWDGKMPNLAVMRYKAKAGTRALNHFLDNLAIGVLSYASLYLFANLDPYNSLGLTIYKLYLLWFLLWLTYFTGLESLTGKTFGKWVTNTKVVNFKGQRPPLNKLLIRSLSRLIPFEPLSFLNAEASGWHDELSNTRVVYDRHDLSPIAPEA